MARYVMANRRAGKFQESEKKASRAALESGFSTLFAANVDVINDLNPDDALARRVIVFDGEPEEVAAKSASLGADVIVEHEILHYPIAAVAGMSAAVMPSAAAPQTSFSVQVTGGGAPLRGAEVLLFAVDQTNQAQQLKATSDASGGATFAVPATLRPAAVVVLPAGGFWSMVSRTPVSGAA